MEWLCPRTHEVQGWAGSIREALVQLGFNTGNGSTISKVCAGKRRTALGYEWRYMDCNADTNQSQTNADNGCSASGAELNTHAVVQLAVEMEFSIPDGEAEHVDTCTLVTADHTVLSTVADVNTCTATLTDDHSIQTQPNTRTYLSAIDTDHCLLPVCRDFYRPIGWHNNATLINMAIATAQYEEALL